MIDKFIDERFVLHRYKSTSFAGTACAQEAFAERLKKAFGWDSVIPDIGDSIEV